MKYLILLLITHYVQAVHISVDSTRGSNMYKSNYLRAEMDITQKFSVHGSYSSSEYEQVDYTLYYAKELRFGGSYAIGHTRTQIEGIRGSESDDLNSNGAAIDFSYMICSLLNNVHDCTLFLGFQTLRYTQKIPQTNSSELQLSSVQNKYSLGFEQYLTERFSIFSNGTVYTYKDSIQDIYNNRTQAQINNTAQALSTGMPKSYVDLGMRYQFKKPISIFSQVSRTSSFVSATKTRSLSLGINFILFKSILLGPNYSISKIDDGTNQYTNRYFSISIGGAL